MLPTMKKLSELEGVTLHISKLPLECYTLEDFDAAVIGKDISKKESEKLYDLLAGELELREWRWEKLGLM